MGGAAGGGDNAILSSPLRQNVEARLRKSVVLCQYSTPAFSVGGGAMMNITQSHSAQIVARNYRDISLDKYFMNDGVSGSGSRHHHFTNVLSFGSILKTLHTESTLKYNL